MTEEQEKELAKTNKIMLYIFLAFWFLSVIEHMSYEFA